MINREKFLQTAGSKAVTAAVQWFYHRQFELGQIDGWACTKDDARLYNTYGAALNALSGSHTIRAPGQERTQDVRARPGGSRAGQAGQARAS